ncbi:unnamed protein product [Rodentolepis nana]|uniref:Serum response factor-binding protein 1 n=1 Tax=Rodentolepis nana TaxID=102285 RepID=A0A0R3TBK4_RODNA|nr:unnamed protein product [Rodentolepis nana]
MPLTYSIKEEQQQLSIDVVDLNNIVLRMRPLVKKAKVLVLRELALYIKRQKSKQLKIPEDQSKRLGRKIVNRLAEVRLLKKMNVDKLSKLVLANVNSHDMLEKGGETLTKQERIVIRVSVCPDIAKFVTDFREKHNDWPTLVHYLLYKNTSGKWKTTEQKRKATKRKKKKGDLPLPIGELDVSNDEQVESTLQKFKTFKDAHDRELIEAQKRILEEEKLGIVENENDSEGDVSNEGQMQVDRDIRPSEVNHSNPEMKVFINELLEMVNRGEKIDDSLLIGDELKGIPEPIEANPEVKEEIQKSKRSKVKQNSEAVNASSQKIAQSMEKVELGVLKSSPSAEEGEKEKPAKLNRKQRRLEKAKAPEAPSESVQMPGIEVDGMLHEIITENIGDDEDASEDDDILGCDDLKNRSAKPGDRAIYRRYVKQRNLHNLKNKFEPSTFRRAGFRKGNVSAKPKFGKNAAASKEELPLHPSWEAKRKQKARLSVPIKIVVD